MKKIKRTKKDMRTAKKHAPVRRAQQKRPAKKKMAIHLPAYFSDTLSHNVLVVRVVFCLSVCALIIMGLVMVYSASFVMGITSQNQDPSSYFVKQIVSIGLGLLFLWLVASIDYHKYNSQFIYVLAGASLLVLLAVLGLGAASHGALRWFSIGPLTIQPSEFVKAVVIIALAVFCYQYVQQKSITAQTFLLRAFGVCGVLCGLILLQPDKGTALTLGVTMFIMLLVAGVARKPLILIFCLLTLAFVLYSLCDPYSYERFATMLNPQNDPYGSGYQLLQGFYAFGSGGLFGVGLGMGREKYAYLPEMHNDFIFAVIGEELGLVGCIVVILLFVALLWSGIQIAKQAPDMLGSLIAFGSVTLLFVALLLNTFGVLGLFPLSGKAIPFISYGGSAMMGSLILVGLVVQVSKHAESHPSKRARTHDEPRLRRYNGGKARR